MKFTLTFISVFFSKGRKTIFQKEGVVSCFAGFFLQEFDTFEGCGALPLFLIISCVPPIMLELCVSSEDKKTKSRLSQQQSVHQIVLKIAMCHVSYDAGEECSHIQ